MEFEFCKYLKREAWKSLSSSSVREEDRIFRGEDLISSLPEPILCHILSFLTTEEAVWTSVLSSRWRYLWKWVPRLELDSFDFTNDRTCVDFIDKFLNFQSKSYLREFKLLINRQGFNFQNDASLYGSCLFRMDKRKIQHFQVDYRKGGCINDIETPLTLSVCEALVSLKLHFVELSDSESLSLPCLKTMYLEDVIFPSDAAVEALISCSPVLEVLKISLGRYDAVVVLRVRSQSLKSFTLKRADPLNPKNGGYAVVVDTPRLEYLSLMDHQFPNFKIMSTSDSFKADIDIEFEIMGSCYSSERNIYYSFFENFSGVGDMTISWQTLKLIYTFGDMNPLPKFHGLTRFRGTMCPNASMTVLPIILESCPNLKHLALELVTTDFPVRVIIKFSTVPSRCLVSSLESVEIVSPVTEEETELLLVRYFLEESTTLKKLVLRVNQSTGEKHDPEVLEELIESPRASSLCQFEIVPVIPTPNPWPGLIIVTKPNRF